MAKKSFFILLIGFAVLSSAHAGAIQKKCDHALTRHLQQAIEHNQAQYDVYSLLSNQKSEKLSFLMMSYESLALPVAELMDLRAQYFHEHDISVLCDEIPEMTGMPKVNKVWSASERPQQLRVLNINDIQDKIESFAEQNNYASEYNYIASILNQIQSEPHQLCLTRHFLESMARTLLLKNNFEKLAKSKNLDSPSEFIEDYIDLQRHSLSFVYYLDRQAFAVQKKYGVPIYCADVPSIVWK